MSSEVLVSRPPLEAAVVETERVPRALHPSSGAATAGFRSAKYTPDEWHSKNYDLLYRTIVDCDEAQRIQRESKTMYKDAEEGTQRTQAEGTRYLGERLQDIHFWESELKGHIEKLLAETDLLLAQRKRLENALDSTEIPYAIAIDNLNCRERRLGPDLVKDSVENELHKEVDLIKNIQALLKRTIAQVISQIKINRDAKLTLELDWSDKNQAYNLDNQCGHFNNMSTDTQHHPGSASMYDQVCNRESWMKFTQNNLTKASRELQASMDLRVLVNRVLQETAEDLREQCSTVDQVFSQRCLEMAEAKTQLELHLAQILEKIGSQERNIVALEQAIHDKQAPLRVAQSRLYVRSFRPNMELCKDDPQFSLVGEVGDIEATLRSLRQQLSEARSSLARLEESRMILEKEIICKSHSLFIDREKCMTHRTHYPGIIALSGY